MNSIVKSGYDVENTKENICSGEYEKFISTLAEMIKEYYVNQSKEEI